MESGAPTATLLLLALAAGGCGGDDDGDEAAPANDVGIVALGHSGLTGHNADPDAPGTPAPENSWATGTNPEIASVYTRLVEQRPETEGMVANEAEGGAVVGDVLEQARTAFETVPNPALVIVQALDNDLTCEGDAATNAELFGASLADALEYVSTEAPGAHIFVVGWTGRPNQRTIEQIIAENPELREQAGGPGPCDFYTESGDLNADAFANLTEVIETYEAVQAEVCAAVPLCVTDDGAAAAYDDTIDKVSNDFVHLNTLGLTDFAGLMWPRIAETLGLESSA